MRKLAEFVQKLRRRKNIFFGKEPAFYGEINVRSACFGDIGANWVVASDYVHEKSIIYSIGVGENISFELSLIKSAGPDIYAFDPTPRSLKWIKSQTVPHKFHFYPLGLAKSDGEITFYPPLNPNHVSFSVTQEGHTDKGVVLPVRRLASLMSPLGHVRLDLLKMDIEGSEYGVIEDIVTSKYSIGQILVEFHHWMPGYTRADTEKAVKLLRNAGYRLFDVSLLGKEYGFIHESILKNAPI